MSSQIGWMKPAALIRSAKAIGILNADVPPPALDDSDDPVALRKVADEAMDKLLVHPEHRSDFVAELARQDSSEPDAPRLRVRRITAPSPSRAKDVNVTMIPALAALVEMTDEDEMAEHISKHHRELTAVPTLAQVSALAAADASRWATTDRRLKVVAAVGPDQARTQLHLANALHEATSPDSDRLNQALTLVERGHRWLLEPVATYLAAHPVDSRAAMRWLAAELQISDRLDDIIRWLDLDNWEATHVELCTNEQLVDRRVASLLFRSGAAADSADEIRHGRLIERAVDAGTEAAVNEHRFALALATMANEEPIDVLLPALEAAVAVSTRSHALELLGTAIDLYRDLALADEQRFSADLAAALNNRSAIHTRVGRLDEALLDGNESASRYRSIDSADDELVNDLAMVLNNISSLHRMAGRVAQALSSADESVALRRDLASRDPERFSADLAASLNNRSNARARAGLIGEALADIDDALLIYRRLHDVDPDRFVQDLTISLNNRSNVLDDAGSHVQALADANEVVSIRRRLCDANASEHEDDLALSLNNRSTIHYSLGDPEQALLDINEAVDIRRRLSEANPSRFSPDLAASLNNRSNVYSYVGDLDDALSDIAEAISLRRKLTGVAPLQYGADLAASLNNRSNIHSNAGRFEAAFTDIDEAVVLYRRLAEDQPARFTLDLAAALNNSGNAHRRANRPDAAISKLNESTALYEQLAQIDPERFEPDVAISLNNRSAVHRDAGNLDDALADIDAAVTRRRELAAANRNRFEGFLATSIHNRSVIQSDRGELESALDDAREATQLRWSLAQSDATTNSADLAASLSNLGLVLRLRGDLDEALTQISEAISIRRGLLKRDPPRFTVDLATSINIRAHVHADAGRLLEGFRDRLEAVRLVRHARLPPPTWLSHEIGDLERSLLQQTHVAHGLQLLELSRGWGQGAPREDLDRLPADVREHEPALVLALEEAIIRYEVAIQRDALTAEESRLSLVAAEERVRAVSQPIDASPDKWLHTAATMIPSRTVCVVSLVDDSGGTHTLVDSSGVLSTTPFEMTRGQASELDDVVRRWSHPLSGTDDAARRHQLQLELPFMATSLGTAFAPALDLIARLRSDADELHLVPVGWLASLPWHLATINGRTLCEQYSVRQLPSLGHLNRPAPDATTTATTVISPFTDDLPFTEIEAAVVRELRTPNDGFGRGANPDEVLTSMSASTATHLATHCSVGATPDQSFIGLSPGVLSAPDLARQASTARLEAYISACSSALSDARNPDEQLGFVSSLLSVGYRRVLATPWPVDDAAAALLAIGYYEHRTSSPSARASDAVRATRRRLRAGTATELTAWIRRIESHNPNTEAAAQLQRLRWWIQLQFEPTDTPYRHPVFWGGLTLTG